MHTMVSWSNIEPSLLPLYLLISKNTHTYNYVCVYIYICTMYIIVYVGVLSGYNALCPHWLESFPP